MVCSQRADLSCQCGNDLLRWQVFETLRTARQSGITLNIITVNAALAACVNCGDIDRALELYRMMVHPGGVGADNITYGTLLKVQGWHLSLNKSSLASLGRMIGVWMEVWIEVWIGVGIEIGTIDCTGGAVFWQQQLIM